MYGKSMDLFEIKMENMRGKKTTIWKDYITISQFFLKAKRLNDPP